ncbi:unnamed protein product [Cylicocyclus nassatus]|uniref:Glycosyltransferase family 92 protein n=1 Tax=Cylicocyclus nassatus TaxID=53992 RepID=A0AA36MBL1_CYLNA|nr:unnamed protein product [Cylicocyclus nassatus]
MMSATWKAVVNSLDRFLIPNMDRMRCRSLCLHVNPTMRCKCIARLLAVFLSVVIFGTALIGHITFTSGFFRNGRTDHFDRLEKATTKSSQLIQRSVLIRYGDTDPLAIFSAHKYQGNVTVILSSYGYMMRRLFCRFFDKEQVEIFPPRQITVFPEFTARCGSYEKASFVAVTLNDDEKVGKSEMQRIEEPRAGQQHYFSVCLAPLWGNSPKWLMLIEFIEYYLLQGAQHFYIYKQNADILTEAVLRTYINEGIIEVIEINEETNCLKRHRCRHEMQLQDCTYRSRGRSKWVATVDLDERISMNSGKDLKNFIKSVDKESYGELRFRCRWVLRQAEAPTDPTLWRSEGAQIPMAIWHNTSHVAPVNHTSKSIIQPLKVEGMSVHQVLRFSPDADAFLVPSETAVVRHYRHVQGWTFFLKEAESFGSFEKTDVSKHLLDALQNKVRQKADELFPNS